MSETKTCVDCGGPLADESKLTGLPAEALAYADMFCPACMVKRIEGKETCPRCGGALYESLADLGALSRSDNETTVCGPCGSDEAMVWMGQEAAIEVLPSWSAECRDEMTRRHFQGKNPKMDA